MAKSRKRWDVVYETVDEQAHKIVEHTAATNVDWKTALTVKRNHKKICAMTIRPTQRARDVANTWRCKCTCINSDHRSVCYGCGSPRP